LKIHQPLNLQGQCKINIGQFGALNWTRPKRLKRTRGKAVLPLLGLDARPINIPPEDWKRVHLGDR